jgi:hypothetical protein
LTHWSFAAPLIASHFSIATLYCASRVSSRASCRAEACFRSAFCSVVASTFATFALAFAFVCAAFASYPHTSFWLPDMSSHFSFATS